jgi:hypothetical protein
MGLFSGFINGIAHCFPINGQAFVDRSVVCIPVLERLI